MKAFPQGQKFMNGVIRGEKVPFGRGWDMCVHKKKVVRKLWFKSTPLNYTQWSTDKKNQKSSLDVLWDLIQQSLINRHLMRACWKPSLGSTYSLFGHIQSEVTKGSNPPSVGSFLGVRGGGSPELRREWVALPILSKRKVARMWGLAWAD